VAEEPLRYMRKYLRVEDELDDLELELELDAGLDVAIAAEGAEAAVGPQAPAPAWESKRISIVPMRPKAG
jgi:hypothetical protein